MKTKKKNLIVKKKILEKSKKKNLILVLSFYDLKTKSCLLSTNFNVEKKLSINLDTFLHNATHSK